MLVKQELCPYISLYIVGICQFFPLKNLPCHHTLSANILTIFKEQ